MRYENEAASDLLTKSDLVLQSRRNAKRYIAKVDEAGRIVVTIPRGGNQRDAIAFANEHRDWLSDQQRSARETKSEKKLRPGDEILFRGAKVCLEVSKNWGRPVVTFADQTVFIADEAMDLSRPVGQRLREIAKRELPSRTNELAQRFGLSCQGVQTRSQKTRWGSCSSSGRISLNWRLVMTPPEVSDYILIHELMHLKEMNHSHVFWRHVREACPRYREHEKWLHQRQSEMAWD